MDNIFQCSKGEYQLFHARSYYHTPKVQGITVAVSHAEGNEGVKIVAISICSELDEYSNKLGHKQVKENLEAGDFFAVESSLWDDLDKFSYYDKEFMEAVIIKLCLLNRTKSLLVMSDKCKRQIEYLARTYHYPLPDKCVEPSVEV